MRTGFSSLKALVWSCLSLIAWIGGCQSEVGRCDAGSGLGLEAVRTLQSRSIPQVESPAVAQSVSPGVRTNQTPESLGPIAFAFPHVDREPVEHLRRAQALHADDDLAGAMLELEKALFDNPADYGAALLLGKIARGQGRTELAIEALRLATQIEEETDEPWLELARLSLSTGQLEQAEQLAQRVLRLNPKRALAHNILGRVWLSRSHWQRAIHAFEAALELSPKSSYFRNNLGYALLLKKDSVRAVEVLEPLGSRTGLPAYMHNNLGLAYEGAGRLPEAVAAYKRSLGVRPGYVNAQVNLDRLVQVARRADAKVQVPDPAVESTEPDSDPDGPAEDLILPEMESL